MRRRRRVAARDRHRDIDGQPRERRLGWREVAGLDRRAVIPGDQIDAQGARDRDRRDIERRARSSPGSILGLDIGQSPIALDGGFRAAFDAGGDQIVDELGKIVLEAPAGAASVGAAASPLRFSPDSSLRSRKALCRPTNSSIDTFASR